MGDKYLSTQYRGTKEIELNRQCSNFSYMAESDQFNSYNCCTLVSRAGVTMLCSSVHDNRMHVYQVLDEQICMAILPGLNEEEDDE